MAQIWRQVRYLAAIKLAVVLQTCASVTLIDLWGFCLTLNRESAAHTNQTKPSPTNTYTLSRCNSHPATGETSLQPRWQREKAVKVVVEEEAKIKKPEVVEKGEIKVAKEVKREGKKQRVERKEERSD